MKARFGAFHVFVSTRCVELPVKASKHEVTKVMTLIDAFHREGFEVAVETNGTQPAPAGLDWICVSPKADAPLVLTSGSELKLVFPQEQAMPERFEDLAFDHFFLQPMDGPAREENTNATLRYCLEHPRWRISLQTHKLLGIP